jgi:acetyl esterase/lipase
MSLEKAPHSFRYLPAIRYGTANGVPLYLDMLVPEPPPGRRLPAVVYVHGGGWESGERQLALVPWINPLLAGNGFVAVSVGYRLSGEAPFPAQMEDVTAAVRWLRDNAAMYGVDPDQIGAWADSAGGHLAALLALTTDTVRAVVARCAPTDFIDPQWTEGNDVLERLFAGPLAERIELRRQASPICHA